METPSAALPDSPESPTVGEQAIELHWVRLAWAGEFLLAMIAASTVWSEVGGQVHLDMMPWYLKLAPLLAFAWCTVRLTMALVQEAAPWRGRSVRWLVAVLLSAAAMFAITAWYHMHEPADDSDQDEGLSTSMGTPAAEEPWRFSV